jgi:dTDP-4-amino-4,6-dideoxygalactose transaminase
MAGAETELAILGGPKVVREPLTPFRSIGVEEIEAARAVMETGVLSEYLAARHDHFLGGPKVREFEASWRTYFGVRHAVTMNSLTSGLIAAVGAVGIEPGDEVITTPWTMSATATSILHWNAIPVFADIESETFCLDPAAVEAQITPHTRAIIATDIFGHSADIGALRSIAKANDLLLLSDAAQAPGALYGERFAGTLADAGGYSLNYHKHIHTGEGGVIVTDDDVLAERLQLIRNHAEAVVEDSDDVNALKNLVGYNFRLGEIECAIGMAQLKKLPRIIERRQRICHLISDGLRGLDGLSTPVERPGCTHAFYVYPLVLADELGPLRGAIRRALEAEGVPDVMTGYQNVHLLPMYQRKIAFGSAGFPWTFPGARQHIDYSKGICPTAEKLHDSTFLGLASWKYDLTDEDAALIVEAFHKVWRQLHRLANPTE